MQADSTGAAQGSVELYGITQKRAKLDSQRIGDYIVKASEVFHFKIVSERGQIDGSSADQPIFFAPKFTHFLFETERIQGYEGLEVLIFLSSKHLVPYVKISYRKKAPSFAKIDKLEEIIQSHFEIKVYTDLDEYVKEVLEVEKSERSLSGEQYA